MNILELTRRNKNLTQIDAANLLGWSVRKYNVWESHPERLVSIKFEDVVALSNEFEIEIGDIFNMFTSLLSKTNL